jgi:serine/threonine-protein kinase HipA
MKKAASKSVSPDALSIWELSNPVTPVKVGVVSLAGGGRAIAFQYDPNWVVNGYALSGDLPLGKAPFVPTRRDEVPGGIADAMPDNWGERAIRFLVNPPRASALDFLYYAGDDRFGSLGFSADPNAYAPYPSGPLPTIASLTSLQTLINRIEANDPLDEREKLLASSTRTMGGAHPKALLAMDGKEWIAKFPRAANIDIGLVEHATMRLAASAGITVAETVALPTAFGHIVAVERFDRKDGRRFRALSARTVLLRGVGGGPPALDELSYGAMASFLQQVGCEGEQATQRAEIFRRMAFNILIENSDDHEKNHAFVFHDPFWSLSPAFDVLPTTLNTGSQQMIVGEKGSDDSIANALSECHLFGLSREQAIEIWFSVADVVSKWADVFAASGVSPKDIDYLRTFIDAPTRKPMRSREILESIPAG